MSDDPKQSKPSQPRRRSNLNDQRRGGNAIGQSQSRGPRNAQRRHCGDGQEYASAGISSGPSNNDMLDSRPFEALANGSNRNFDQEKPKSLRSRHRPAHHRPANLEDGSSVSGNWRRNESSAFRESRPELGNGMAVNPDQGQRFVEFSNSNRIAASNNYHYASPQVHSTMASLNVSAVPFCPNSPSQSAPRQNSSMSGRKQDFQSKAKHRPDAPRREVPNYRPQSNHRTQSPAVNAKFDDGDPDSQRKRFEEQLVKGEYECMVCCEEVRNRSQIWSCSQCYIIYHLGCIKKWADTNARESSDVSADKPSTSWRCPACQYVHQKIPDRYYCFCGKQREPNGRTAHSCGQLCGRIGLSDPTGTSKCNHLCDLLCHPGPCPICAAKVTRFCCCGAKSLQVDCGSPSEAIHCTKVCGMQLACGQHYCELICHSGPCGDCKVELNQTCFCGKEQRSVACTRETGGKETFVCNEVCDKKLQCGSHFCADNCHAGPCSPCPLSPNLVTTCPCGRNSLRAMGANARSSCTAKIMTCKEICYRTLACGPKGEPHKCAKKCHNKACTPCPLKTIVRCTCGANSECLNCAELTADKLSFSCKKRCNKKLNCTRHKCINECCVDTNHDCTQVCGKKLACGSHFCQEPCHRNACGNCWNVSWDELKCTCGAQVILPPIQCGTKPPKCDQPCTRQHACYHRVDHKCHSDTTCPPCTELVSKVCYGGHEQRTSVLCYMDGVSCGKRCNKLMSCAYHQCQKVCHQGECGDCTYPCPTKRLLCDHPCNLPCHESSSKTNRLIPSRCPPSKCRISLKVTCACQRMTDTMQCYSVTETATRLTSSMMARLTVRSDDGIDVNEIVRKANENKLCRLECDEKCLQVERNKQLAEAFGIKDADLEVTTQYPEVLKQYAAENVDLAADVYERLTILVNDAKRSTLSFKNHNFPPMRTDQRQFIHELAEVFGCKSHSVDNEPNRSVVVKAPKERCRIPSVSILDIIQKKNSWLVLSQKGATVKQLEKTARPKVESKPAWKPRTQQVDYFDFLGD